MNNNFEFTQEQINSYNRDGYLIVKGLFNKEEIAKLYSVAIDDINNKQNSSADLNDQTGKKTRLSMWFTPGEDTYSLLTRSERMVKTVSQLIDSDAPIAHYHSKLMQKEPKVGGAWEWHQDYGYWYKNQFMFPDKLISVMVAITKADKSNGCLQVIKGSHKIGRVNHGFAGEQMGADMVFVNNALEIMEHQYVELEAGDALYFHPNTFHRSEANLSDYPRWSLISCYNSIDNVAFNEKSTSYLQPIDVVSNTAILEKDAKGFGLENDMYDKAKDPALQKTGWEEQAKV